MPILQMFNPVQNLKEGAAMLKEKEKAKAGAKSKGSTQEETKSQVKDQQEASTPLQPPLKKKESIFNKLFKKKDKATAKQD